MNRSGAPPSRPPALGAMPTSSLNAFPRSSGYPSAPTPSPNGGYSTNGPPPPPPPGSQQQQRGQQSPYPSAQHPRTPGTAGSSQGYPLSGGGMAGAQSQQQQQQRSGAGSFPFGGGLQQQQQQGSNPAGANQSANQHQQNLLSMMSGGGTPQIGNAQPQSLSSQQGPPSATPSHQSLFSSSHSQQLSHSQHLSSAGGNSNEDADFPALGGANGANASLAALNAQSYAAQASALQAAQQGAHGQQPVGNGAFNADDFPALGGDGSMLNGVVGGAAMMGLAGQMHQQQQQQQQQQHQQQQQIQQGQMGGGVGQGGKGARGLQEDMRMANAGQSAWPTQTPSAGAANALAPPPGQQSRPPPPNGTPLPSHPSPQPPSDLLPPPQQQQQQQQLQQQQAGQPPQEGPFPTQTVPAEQVLASPADKWGLAAFLHAIRNADEDRGMLAFGTDLMSLGMNMAGVDPLSTSLVAPWADPALTRGVHLEEEFHTPSCYNVRPAAAQTKMNLFAEETLFYVFYACPRDALQEFAAQELYARHWRWHKEIGYWLTKDPRAEATEKTASYERGTYIFFDPATWSRVEQKDFTLAYEFLEDRSQQQQQAVAAAAAAAQAQQQQVPAVPAGAAVGGNARAFGQIVM